MNKRLVNKRLLIDPPLLSEWLSEETRENSIVVLNDVYPNITDSGNLRLDLDVVIDFIPIPREGG